MGRILRRFARFFELEMRGNLEIGAWAAPIAQYEAGQVLLNSVISTTALGGNVAASYCGVTVSVNMTGDPVALRVRANVEADIAIAGGFARGMYVSADMQDGSSVEYGWDGIYLAMYQHAGASCPGNVAAITIRNYVAGTTGIYYFMYMQENVAALMTGAFYIRVAGDIDNLFYLFPTTTTGWAAIGNPGNQDGWIKVSLAGTIRWIQLWAVAP